MKTVIAGWRTAAAALAACFLSFAPARAQVTAEITVPDDWGSGYTANVAIRNQTAAAIENWVLEIDATSEIGEPWNGVTLLHPRGTFRIGPAGWNKTIPAGGRVEVGFVGSPGNVIFPAGSVRIKYDVAGSGGTSGSTGSGGANPSPTNPPPPAVSPPAGAPFALVNVDDAREANQVDAPLGVALVNFVTPPANPATVSVTTNNPTVLVASVTSDGRLRLEGLKPGRAGLKLVNSATGAVRHLGVRVLQANGQPPGLPEYLGIGSVSEDSLADLDFFRAFAPDRTNRRVDFRYIYLNGGPENGWRTWSSAPGGRVTSYVRESLRLGMIPFFVYYNVPDGGESYFTNREHLVSASYMRGYFDDLKLALQLTRAEAGDDIVGFILEPDMLGYFAQSDPRHPDEIPAMTAEAYAAGLLVRGTDPDFPNTLRGFVEAVNYIIRHHLPSAHFGWQLNLWASPAGGWTTPIGARGLMRLTDTLGLAPGRAAIDREARAIADYYIACGVLAHGADFVSIDKYGLDAGSEGKAADPAAATWFWNAQHWTNYLIFVQGLHARSGLPVVLWQLPVGRINNSLLENPHASGQGFPALENTSRRHEDSAPAYFFGDTFAPGAGARFNHFSAPDGVSAVSTAGANVTWGEHLSLAKEVGVTIALFGAGVGDSTDGVGSPPTDDYWWITKVQDYYANPVSLAGANTGIPVAGGGTGGGSTDGGGTGGGSPGGGTGGGATPTLAVSANFTVAGSWSGGFTGQLALTNTGGVGIGNWTVSFDADFNIESMWNAVLVGRSGNHYIARAESWNNAWAPGTTIKIGFTGNPGNPAAPTNITVQSGGSSTTIGSGTGGSSGGSTGGGSTGGGTGPGGGDTTPAPAPTPATPTEPTLGPPPVAPAPPTTPTPPTPPTTPGVSGKRVVAYFAEWGIYQRNYQPWDMPLNSLTHVIYAFTKIANGEIAVFDDWAAHGVAAYPGQPWDGSARGNYAAFRRLKEQHPHLKTIVAVGGWTLSDTFSVMAATAAGREKFAASVVRFTRAEGFDGVDLDWEYPVVTTEVNQNVRPEDGVNYVELVKELRRQFDIAGAQDGKPYLITAATPAGWHVIEKMNLGGMASYLDWFNVMTYDYHGAWEPHQTNHLAPMYHNPAAANSGNERLNADWTIRAYLAAGVPADKIVLGAPLYSRAWGQVANTNNGLFAAANGPSAGEFGETGMHDYRSLHALRQSDPQYVEYWDAAAQTAWIHNAARGLFFSYDNPRTLRAKLDYIKANSLGGVMFWELSNDLRDPAHPDALVPLAARELGAQR